MREPRHVCPECTESADPAAAKPVDERSERPDGERDGVQAMLYFHRDHVWPGWAAIEAPDAWDKHELIQVAE